jgi:NAD(P)-dependent dehydrogenase (short-subunit alcohol dehydrogenase family)
MEELRGKVAVITGGAEGIGRAVAERAADAGMRLVLGDVNPSALEQATAELASKKADVLGVVVDVSEAASVGELARRAKERFGAVSLLVNNAGIAAVHTAWDGPIDAWTRTMGVNVFGIVHCLRAFVPDMIAAGEPAHVVNVASAAGLVSSAGLAAYCASKQATVALSESLYQDLRARKTKVGVSVVCPSWVKTKIALRGPAASGDALTQGIGAAIAAAVRNGIEPLDLATSVLDAVRANRFYVISHDTTKAGFAVRAKDILEGRPPTMFPIG